MNETREEKVTAARTRMAELAMKFIDRSRDDLRAMRESLAKAGAGDAGALAHIRQLAHRMAGTGATLGYEALGVRAAATETLVGSPPEGAPPDAALLEKLADAIAALESELANVARGSGGA